MRVRRIEIAIAGSAFVHQGERIPRFRFRGVSGKSPPGQSTPPSPPSVPLAPSFHRDNLQSETGDGQVQGDRHCSQCIRSQRRKHATRPQSRTPPPTFRPSSPPPVPLAPSFHCDHLLSKIIESQAHRDCHHSQCSCCRGKSTPHVCVVWCQLAATPNQPPHRLHPTVSLAASSFPDHILSEIVAVKRIEIAIALSAVVTRGDCTPHVRLSGISGYSTTPPSPSPCPSGTLLPL